MYIVLQTIFWTLFLLVLYTYIGYGLLLHVLVGFKKGDQSIKSSIAGDENLPMVAFIIAAYNEEDVIERKIRNTMDLNYPRDQMKIIVVADGSTDTTTELIQKHPGIIISYDPDRGGKASALNKGVSLAGNASILIFSDANTLVNPDAVRLLVRHYADSRVGAVSGEKKVVSGGLGMVQADGESMYWKYESHLKKLDSDFNTMVGAAGELLSVRRELYIGIPQNIILDDFYISINICIQGYLVKYEPGAVALEQASTSISEEKKRKIRISAGAFQAIGCFMNLLNPFSNPRLSFQYISHRVMRWVICPLALPFILIINGMIVYFTVNHTLYEYLFCGQIILYVFALVGYLINHFNLSSRRIFNVPYYFLFMNYSVWLGFFRFINNSQSVIWDKSDRRPFVE